MQSLFRLIVSLLILAEFVLPSHAQHSPEDILKKAKERLSGLKSYQVNVNILFVSGDSGVFNAHANLYMQNGRSPRRAIDMIAGDGSTGAFQSVEAGDSALIIDEGKKTYMVVGKNGKPQGTISKPRKEKLSEEASFWIPDSSTYEEKMLVLLPEAKINGILSHRVAILTEKSFESLSIITDALDKKDYEALKKIKDIDFSLYCIDSTTFRLIQMSSLEVKDKEFIGGTMILQNEVLNGKIPDTRFRVPKLAPSNTSFSMTSPLLGIASGLSSQKK